MDNCVITIESTCDLTDELIKKYQLHIIDMEYIIGEEKFSTKTDTVQTSGIYPKMRNGEKTYTSQVNEEVYYDTFKSLVQKGQKVLHLAFSSGLSNTYLCAESAAKKINEEYGKMVYVIDSKCACGGHGVFGMMARIYMDSMNSIEEVVEKLESIKLMLRHSFSVENLKYLARGGRISSSSAIIGNILNVKPTMKMNDEGKLVVIGKVLSRKKALDVIAKDFINNRNPDFDMCLISHADCLEDAKYIAQKIEDNTDQKVIITDLGPIIGAHSGPGTISLYFFANNR